MTYLHCPQHSFFEHPFNLYYKENLIKCQGNTVGCTLMWKQTLFCFSFCMLFTVGTVINSCVFSSNIKLMYTKYL